MEEIRSIAKIKERAQIQAESFAKTPNDLCLPEHAREIFKNHFDKMRRLQSLKNDCHL